MYGTLVVSYKQGGNARHSPFTQMRTSEWRAFLIFKKTKETTMSKELAKTYDPKGLEDRLYQKWLDSEETIYHCYAAAKRNRTAAYGPCTG